MKPTIQLNEMIRRGDTTRPNSRRVASPRTDYHFRGSYGDDFLGGGGGRKRFPSFRKISEDYFDYEARSPFKSEAAFFGLIVATVALPLFEVARALLTWIR